MPYSTDLYDLGQADSDLVDKQKIKELCAYRDIEPPDGQIVLGLCLCVEKLHGQGGKEGGREGGRERS